MSIKFINNSTLINIWGAIKNLAQDPLAVSHPSGFESYLSTVGNECYPEDIRGGGAIILKQTTSAFADNTLDSVAAVGKGITNMYGTYYRHSGLTGNPVCGVDVIDFSGAYYGCTHLDSFNPVCGLKVINMCNTYNRCIALRGNAACGPNVIDMSSAYQNCYNLSGIPACGSNVINMFHTYDNCQNLTGSPVCGPNVTDMSYAYNYCYHLNGIPACGPNVIDMSSAYYNCSNLTGSPVCGPNVTDMNHSYYGCYNLTGSPVCGPNVTDMNHAYYKCSDLKEYFICDRNKPINTSWINYCFNNTPVRSVFSIYDPIAPLGSAFYSLPPSAFNGNTTKIWTGDVTESSMNVNGIEDGRDFIVGDIINIPMIHYYTGREYNRRFQVKALYSVTDPNYGRLQFIPGEIISDE